MRGSSSESSSDDEPEDVGFDESKQKAMEHVQVLTNQLVERKQLMKAKRKDRDELFKKQKV